MPQRRRRQADEDDDRGIGSTSVGSSPALPKRGEVQEQPAEEAPASPISTKKKKKKTTQQKQEEQEQRDRELKEQSLKGTTGRRPPKSSTRKGAPPSRSDAPATASGTLSSSPFAPPPSPGPKRGDGLKAGHSEMTTLHKNSKHKTKSDRKKKSPPTSSTPPLPPSSQPKSQSNNGELRKSMAPAADAAAGNGGKRERKKKKKKRTSTATEGGGAGDAPIVQTEPVGSSPKSVSSIKPGAHRVPGVNAQPGDDLEPNSYRGSSTSQNAKQDGGGGGAGGGASKAMDSVDEEGEDGGASFNQTAHGTPHVVAHLAPDDDDMADRIAQRVQAQMEEQLRRKNDDIEMYRRENEYLRRTSRDPSTAAFASVARAKSGISRDSSAACSASSGVPGVVVGGGAASREFSTALTNSVDGSRDFSFADGLSSDMEFSIPAGEVRSAAAAAATVNREPSGELGDVVHAVPMSEREDGDKDDDKYICGLTFTTFVILLVAGFLILAGVVAGVVVATTGKSDEETLPPATTPPITPLPPDETATPTASPTVTPSPTILPIDCTIFSEKFQKLYDKIGLWIDPINPSIKLCDDSYQQHWSMRWMADVDNVETSSLTEQVLVDRFVMTLLYNTTDGTSDEWINNFWFLTPRPTCQWRADIEITVNDVTTTEDRGVICDGDDVIELKLRKLFLVLSVNQNRGLVGMRK